MTQRSRRQGCGGGRGSRRVYYGAYRGMAAADLLERPGGDAEKRTARKAGSSSKAVAALRAGERGEESAGTLRGLDAAWCRPWPNKARPSPRDNLERTSRRSVAWCAADHGRNAGVRQPTRRRRSCRDGVVYAQDCSQRDGR